MVIDNQILLYNLIKYGSLPNSSKVFIIENDTKLSILDSCIISAIT